MCLWPSGIIWLMWALGRILITHPRSYFVASFFSCCTASMADVVIREMQGENRNEHELVVNVLVLWISMSVCAYLPECLHHCVSTRHRVKQPEVWSNFLRVMEVITALARCSDWSLLVTMGWCDFVWGRVSGSRLSNQVWFRREDVFNQADSSYTLQVMRLWIS